MPLRESSWFRCFGCAPHNPRGLRLHPRYDTTARHAECDVVFDADLCSYPGIVHGGLVATAADDLMANLLLMQHGVLTFSTTLRTRFLRPVRTGRPHRIVARSTGDWGTEAEISTAEGELCALVTGAYAPVRAEHITSLFAVDEQEHGRIATFLAKTGNDECD
jgi:acyl-coenzyme A thioesterase PaaI-like protein